MGIEDHGYWTSGPLWSADIVKLDDQMAKYDQKCCVKNKMWGKEWNSSLGTSSNNVHSIFTVYFKPNEVVE